MPRITNKREFLARRMRDVGLLRLLERVARRPGLLVLTYHRIGDPVGQPYYSPIWSATPEAFRAQVARLRDTFRVLSLDEVVTLSESGFALSEPAALVTFDDGQRDNVEVALPILRELGVAATFFLPTALIDAPRLPWWDHVAYTVNATTMPVLRLDRPEPLAIDLERTPRSEAVARVVRACLDHQIDVNGEAAFLAHLDDRAGVSVDAAALGRELFMTWDDARALVAAGMSVGSHARSHRMLAALPADEQRAELAGSKAALERALGRDVAAVAYPYGWAGAFDAGTVRLARAVGYRLGFASVEGVNRPGASDPLALRRLGVGFADSPVLLRARLTLMAAAGRSWL
jgi:peptidoglycan/xylan/chitin deacetylase (PgdA/CDA1 family)